MEAFHTIEPELNCEFTLARKHWGNVDLEKIEQACDSTCTVDVAAVVMQEGLAHICLLTPSMRLLRAKIEMNIHRKRRGNCSLYDKALEGFYKNVIQGI
ncbi:Protein pelota-like protein [Platysternon megacephalum]|uniref:Protein pelota-like protein n=1 Tax=Platysternon megacephalum TaxID=55544 RepID=A0A4D9EIL7_9SAUR|nr:Protein pelota-like protein [Platysternon megacephalum]